MSKTMWAVLAVGVMLSGGTTTAASVPAGAVGGGKDYARIVAHKGVVLRPCREPEGGGDFTVHVQFRIRAGAPNDGRGWFWLKPYPEMAWDEYGDSGWQSPGERVKLADPTLPIGVRDTARFEFRVASRDSGREVRRLGRGEIPGC